MKRKMARGTGHRAWGTGHRAWGKGRCIWAESRRWMMLLAMLFTVGALHRTGEPDGPLVL